MDAPQRFADFEAAERVRGCSEVVVRSWDAETVLDTHSHPFRARALVVEGEMWLTIGDVTHHLRPGDRFEVALGQAHSERYGPQGATYWVARSNA